jgi:hypothetical protein
VATRTRTRDKPDPMVDLSTYERDLTSVMARYRRAEHDLDIAGRERDRVIRDAHGAGMTPTQIAKETGLSVQRIDQIANGRPRAGKKAA